MPVIEINPEREKQFLATPPRVFRCDEIRVFCFYVGVIVMSKVWSVHR
jgi:hypothetical protein